MIQNSRLEKRFIELCKIHGEPRDEQKVASYLTEFFTSRGFTVERDSAHEQYDGTCGNMFVRIPGTTSGPTIMLSAHMDTVVTGGTVEPIYDNGYIRSAGDTILGSDDKAGIAAILEVLEVIKENQLPHPPLLIALTAAEEIGLLGARYCELTGNDADMGVVLDTSGPIGKIVNNAPFHEAYTIKVHGKSAHAGIEPEKGINAIQIAAELISLLPSGRQSDTCTTNIARIRGGVADNIVPELVTIKGEARSTSEAELLKVIGKIQDSCDNLLSQKKYIIEFSTQREYDGYKISETSPIISRLSDAAKAIGKETYITHTGGGSDANFFNKKGIPTAVISCGMSKVHTHNEEILVEDLIDVTRMTLAFVTTL
jgi:tripeptide aminopeptidase